MDRTSYRAQRRSTLRVRWLLSLLTMALLPVVASAQWQQQADDVMGTRVRAEVWHAEQRVRSDALAAVFAEMRRIDETYSPYREASELSRLNRDGPKGWVSVAPEFMALLRRSAQMSRLTDGAFDVTYASVGRYYDYRGRIAPDAATIERAVAAIDYRHVALDEAGGRVRFLHPATYVDLGGIAKGYAVDRAIDIVQGYGIAQASISAGGDSRILGDRRGEPWVVGVRHPRRAGHYAVKLPLADTAVSTSGDYERFFDVDGERFHHILDPGSGRSAQGALSVTILGAEATMTDALSTSVFVLGAKAGIALIDRLPQIDAIVIDAAGRMHYSAGLLDPAAQEEPAE